MDLLYRPAQRAADHPGRRQELIGSSAVSSRRHLVVIESFSLRMDSKRLWRDAPRRGRGWCVVEEERTMSPLPISSREFSRREFLAGAAASGALIMLHPFS